MASRFAGLLILFFILSCAGFSQGQSPEIKWEKTFGGADNDWANSVQHTSDGGYVIVGSTGTYGAGGGDIWIIKTDSAGNKQWYKTFGREYNDEAYSVRETSDGGYIITGYTSSFHSAIDFETDVWLIKIDSAGKTVWDKTFDWIEDEFGYSVQETSDGGYVIAGYGYYSTDLKGYVWLIKTDTSGNIVWHIFFSGGHASSVEQTGDGGYIVAGYYGSTYSPDVWLIKTDTAGNEEWNKTFGRFSSDNGKSVQQTSDGGYVIAGNTYSYGAGGCDVYPLVIG